MEISFYLDDDVAEEFFGVKNMLPNRRNLTGNQFAKLIIQNYIKREYQKIKKEARNMRYYIVDSNGTVYGDFDTLKTAQAHLENDYSKEEIENNELEIIEGE